MRPSDGRAWTLAAALAAMVACNTKGDTRAPSSGSSEFSAAPSSAAGAGAGTTAIPTVTSAGGGAQTPAAGGAGTGSTTPGTVDPNAGGANAGTPSASAPASTSSALTGETLESCQAKTPPKAWVAVVNGGNSPAACADPLVAWCCTRAEIEKQFPTYAQALESGTINGQAQNFQTLIDQQNYTLYACSTDGNNKYIFSLGKIVNGTTFYATIFLPTAFPSDAAAPTTGCPLVKTSDLNKAALWLDDDGTHRAFSDEIEVSGH